MWDDGTTLEILDTRSCATAPRHQLRGALRSAYLELERGRSRRSLTRRLSPLPANTVDRTLDQLAEKRLTLENGGRILALANRPPLRELPTSDRFPGGFVNYSRLYMLQQILGGEPTSRGASGA
jgi:hypothetical protein